MNWKDGDTTSPTLLRRVSDWRDDDAWAEFLERYDPLVRLWVRRYGFNADEAEELRQQIWVDVALRMQVYAYDPSRTFRGWLRRVCESRAIDLVRSRRSRPVGLFNDLPGDPGVLVHPAFDNEDKDNFDAKGPGLLRLGQQVHDCIKGRVEPRTWQAFWHVAIDDWSVRETAVALEMSYAAVFAAQKRVLQMLRSAGRQGVDDRAIAGNGVG
jgi:RNA polymerase sigma factor (sigma-70 family)